MAYETLVAVYDTPEHADAAVISIVVASGPSSGLMSVISVCSGPPDGSCTSTGMRRLPGAGVAVTPISKAFSVDEVELIASSRRPLS